MRNDIEADLRECLTYISADWKMQTNFRDKETRFIYDAESLADCLEKIEKYKVDKSYALHRWYNYMTSVRCEQIFCEYGAKHCGANKFFASTGRSIAMTNIIMTWIYT